jgi:flagellar motor protein MotB
MRRLPARGGKRAGHADASHANDWLMTYADMITLLLCFFVLFATSSFIQKKEAQTPKVEVAQSAPIPAQDQNPPQDQKQVDANVSPLGLKTENRTEWHNPAEEWPIKKETVASASMPPPVDTKAEVAASIDVKEGTSTVNAEEPAAPPPLSSPLPLREGSGEGLIKPTPPDSPPKLAEDPKANGAAPFEQKGDRITSLEMNSAAFFDSGSATLSAQGKDILRGVAEQLKADKFKDYQITVEGHTDDTPIATPAFPSNWELSTARAASVVRFFLAEGLASSKLRAAGYADTFPKLPNRTASGAPIPENQAQNRRVVIKLEKIEKAG